MKWEWIARGLGWFSVGLGLAEIVAPRRLAGFVGLTGRERLLRAYGLREIGAGAAILARRRPAAGVWARVAGDALDLATLGAATAPTNPKRGRALGAVGAVAGITALDAVTALRLGGGRNQAGAASAAAEATRALTIDKPVAHLHRLLRRADTLARLLGHDGEVTVLDPNRARWRAPGPLGRTLEWETRVVEDRPGELIRWQSPPDTGIPNQGEIRFRPGPAGWGTEVALRLRLEPPGGPLAKAAVALGGLAPDLLARQALRRFKSLAETGEIPTLHRQPAARGEGRDN